MRANSIILGAALAAALPAGADAAVTFNVNGVFTAGNPVVPAGTLTGTFTTNDAITSVTALNLISSASGLFAQTTYNDLSTVSTNNLSGTFRVTVAMGFQVLQLTFSPALTSAGAVSIGGNSYETQNQSRAGNRFLTGTVTAGTVAGAVPETATWAMMVLGFGLVGAAARHARRQTGVTFG